MISNHLARHFDPKIRQRGLEYFRAGRVRMLHGSSTEFEARVRNEADFPYEVMLEARGRQLRVSCDCAYFEGGEPCKHTWAAILAAERLRYLTAALNASMVTTRAPGGRDSEAESGSGATAQTGLWRSQLNELLQKPPEVTSGRSWRWPANRRIVYSVDVAATGENGSLAFSVFTQDRRADGEWGRRTQLNLRRQEIALLPDATDQAILAALSGGLMTYNYAWGGQNQAPATAMIDVPLSKLVVPQAARAGRLFVSDRNGRLQEAAPAVWNGNPWTFGLEIEQTGGALKLGGTLQRGDRKIPVADVVLITRAGLVFSEAAEGEGEPGSVEVAPLEGDADFDWMRHLSQGRPIEVPYEERDEFMTSLLNAPTLPKLQVPEELKFEEVVEAPQMLLRISSEAGDVRNYRAALSFAYSGHVILQQIQGSGIYDADLRRYIRRDLTAERAAGELLTALGAQFQSWYDDVHWKVPGTKLPRLIRNLLAEGWQVETDGKAFRQAGEVRVEVTSGVDWFDLAGEVSYGETTAKLPELLEALRRGDNVVRLADGGFGLLPEEWLSKFGLIAGLGEAVDGVVRFRRSQAGLLDALLLAQPEARFDEQFARVRQEIRTFAGVRQAEQPEGFVGQLRDYQREGLGWMDFLRRFGFGGCLADDMGVGKTPQVLALLELRRAQREADPGAADAPGPSLVVVPKSLVFNWKQEAERFTPKLRLLDYTGLGRKDASLAGYDVVITTYGTLRRDVPKLKDVAFDYVVLDEAQAVKNSSSESAKAVRLLKGRNRLVLSGTPVENHLGELWSLFEFLNPGMLGAANVFKMSATRNPDEETRVMLAQALRPFILRRTKSQVARELPERTEQTIHCELEPTQRKLYNELRAHYRSELLGRIQRDGIGKSGIHVLEALLRLRQAACHPGLIDAKRVEEPSAKLTMLMEQLEQVLEEGHKALVFSQFTSLLDIVRKRLDADKTVYEYLDGQTRDRQARVERFQNDPDCKLFLISLKAGGVGLNLTAAGYVFLLDPWWNPAVEAQAIDRAHRIGQTKQVFAYRLIASDTVEEKVLELQKSKRDLASAIISADNSLIRNLKKEDVELLLG